MNTNIDLMFLDFLKEFEGNDESKEMALVHLDTILRDPVQLQRRSVFLESLARGLAEDALPLCSRGLHQQYYDRDGKLDHAEVHLLDCLSRNPIALRAVHERIRRDRLGASASTVMTAAATSSPPHRRMVVALAASLLLAVGAGWWVTASRLNMERDRAASLQAGRDGALRDRDSAKERADKSEQRLTTAIAALQAKDRQIASMQLPSFEQQSRFRISPVVGGGGGALFREIDLAFGDVSPGLISKIEICRDYIADEPNEWATVYYWRSRPLPLSYRLKYEHPPQQPDRGIDTVVRYWLQALSDKQRKELGLGIDQQFVDRRIQLTSTPEGVAFKETTNAVLIATASQVSEDGRVRLALAGSSPHERIDQSTVLHVVIRAVNGTGPWVGNDARLPISGTGISLADISESPTETLVDLKRLGQPERPEDNLPTDYEILVVGLPGTFARLQLTKAEFQSYEGVILSRTTVHWDSPPQFVN